MACWWFWASMVALKGSIYSNIKLQYCQLLLSTALETYLVQSASVPCQVHLVLLYNIRCLLATHFDKWIPASIAAGEMVLSSSSSLRLNRACITAKTQSICPIDLFIMPKMVWSQHFKTKLITRASRDMYVYMKIIRHATAHTLLVYQHL